MKEGRWKMEDGRHSRLFAKILKKEVFSMSMKSLRIGLCAVIAGFVLVGTGQLFATLDVTAGVPSSATVSGLKEMGVVARNRSNDALATCLDFGTVDPATMYKLADQYLVLAATSNVFIPGGAWKIDIYTKNTDPGSIPRVGTISYGAGCSSGVFTAGGLVSTNTVETPAGSTNFFRIPLLWIVTQASSGTLNGTTDRPVPNVGYGDTIKSLIHGSTVTANVGWTYVMDKGDIDNTGTVFNPVTGLGDESWTWAWNSGYTNCLWGGGGGARHLPYLGQLDTKSPVYIYLEGDFQSAGGNRDYVTRIWFDLYH